jgi:hypothetical protein
MFMVKLTENIKNYKTINFLSLNQSKIGFSGSNCQVSTTISSTTVTTTQSSTYCYDLNPANCQYYALNNFCKNIFYINGISMLAYCPKSCNTCQSTTTTTTTKVNPTCTDLYVQCANWAALQYCSYNPIYNICKASCNLC